MLSDIDNFMEQPKLNIDWTPELGIRGKYRQNIFVLRAVRSQPMMYVTRSED